MALASSQRYSGPFVAAANQSQFSIDWPPLGLRIQVAIDGILLAQNAFSVEEITNGAIITLAAPLLSGKKVEIFGDAELERVGTFEPNSQFRAAVLNDELNMLQAQNQEQARDLSRALKLPLGESMDLPKKAELANKHLAFDQSGNPIAASLMVGLSASPIGVSIAQSPNSAAVRDIIAPNEFAQLNRLEAKSFRPNKEISNRKKCHKYAFVNPLATIPTVMGAGEPPMLVAAADSTKAGLSENYIRQHISMLARGGIEQIIISHAEFGGYHWLNGVNGEVWPDRLGASGKPIWYWNLVGGDKTYYQNIDTIGIMVDECEKQGLGVIGGLSRYDDYELLNHWRTTTIGVRPQSNLTIPSGVTGSQSISANLDTFSGLSVGKTIKAETGNGVALITAITNAQNITANITQAFPSGSYAANNWRLLSPDPMSFGLSIAARMTRAVDASQLVASWYIARFGQSPAFKGFFSAFEPDDLEGMGEYFGRVWNISGAKPALKTYRNVFGEKMQWWASPSSPIDLFDTNISRLRAAIVASGISHLSEQDGVGAGTDRLAGTYNYVAGQATTLSQIWAANLAYRKILAGTNVEYLAHNELWEMEGPTYTKAYAATIERLRSQWSNTQDISHAGALYQTLGILALPTDDCRPPISTTFRPTYRADCEALAQNWLDDVASLNKAQALGYGIVNEEFDIKSWSSFGGAFITDVLTYTPCERASAALITADVHISRSGAAGASTGYCEMSLIVGGAELTATRVKALQDDDRSDSVRLMAIVPLKGATTTIGVRIDNQLYAPTSPLINCIVNIKERVG